MKPQQRMLRIFAGTPKPRTFATTHVQVDFDIHPLVDSLGLNSCIFNMPLQFRLYSLGCSLSKIVLLLQCRQCLSYTVTPQRTIRSYVVGLSSTTPTSPRCRLDPGIGSRQLGSFRSSSLKRSGSFIDLISRRYRLKLDTWEGLGRDTRMRSRRRFAMTTAASPGAAESGKATGLGSRSVNWPLWYVLPIAPYQKRKTIMKEIVPGKVRFLK